MNLTPPARQYVTGKKPSHSSSSSLGDHFEGLSKDVVSSILESSGNMRGAKPTKQALKNGLLDVCENSVLWNLSEVEKLLTSAGINARRKYANQNLPSSIGDGPRFGSLTTIGTYFNTSAVQVGKWLDKYGYRDENGEPREQYVKNGLAKIVAMPGKNNKGKTYVQWDVVKIVTLLKNNGHILDFDYKKSLEGKGKNSNVTVSAIDDRVNQFIKDFTKMYNANNRECLRLVGNTPKAILLRAEAKLCRKGFFTNNLFKKKFS